MSSSGREQLRMMGLNVTARDPTMDARTVHSVNVNNKKVRVKHDQMTRFIENAQDVSDHAFRQEERELVRQIERLQRDKLSRHHLPHHSSNHRYQPQGSNDLQTFAVRDDHNQPMYVTVTGGAERDASKISVHHDGTQLHHLGSHHSGVQQPVGYGHTVKEWAHEMGIEQKGRRRSIHSTYLPDRRTSGSYIGGRRDSLLNTGHNQQHYDNSSSFHRPDAASHRAIRQQVRVDQSNAKKPSFSSLHNHRPSDHAARTKGHSTTGGTADVFSKPNIKPKHPESTASSSKTSDCTRGHPKMASEPVLSKGKEKERDRIARSAVKSQQPKSQTKKPQDNDRASKSLHHVQTKQKSTESKISNNSPGNEAATRRRGSTHDSHLGTSKAKTEKNGARTQSKLHQPNYDLSGLTSHPGHRLQLSRETLEEIHALVDQGQGSLLSTSMGTLSRKQQQRLLALQMLSQRLPLQQHEAPEFNAFEVLQSRYLRLSDSNIANLMDICKDEGIEVGIHPHMNIDDVGKIVFAEGDPAAEK
ncbi:uncharacterized protein LOC117109507 [Anneissia japonica]|uniref:uncharacterized protein LOC117109507 n=1 Tax=Anneissia japonica TaxID=1529436 RepID=UPI0014255CFE|nr:uncharacterized protein LOC117109507 [Anneissia japonica]